MNVPSTIREARGLSLALLGSALLLAGACSGGSSSNGSGGTQGSGGSGSGGKSASGGSNGSGGSASGGTVGSGGSGSGGKLGSGGSASGGSASGGSASGGSASGGTVGSGGTPGGSASGGVVGSGGAASGGTSSGGAPGGGGAAGGSKGGGGAPAGSGGTGSGSSDCPAGAFFCSGFEDATLPSALVYKVNAAPGDWSRDFALDTMVHHGGKQSLLVKSSSDSGTSGSQYKMLAVPAAATFWARFYMQSDMDIGGLEHNAFAEASGSDDPNDGVSCEFAEDVGIAFNTKDDDRWPMGYGRTTSGGTMPYSLPKNAWHCIEISYDGAGKVQQLFVEGMQLINATSYPTGSAAFKEFKFGFMQFHGPARHIWYDDIVVSPTRSPCPAN